jgi:ubiquinol-cytochrome c reductase cytochrome b subunit
VLASVFKVAPESITNLFRILIFVVPVIAFFVTRSFCRSLARDKVHPFGGAVGSRVRRTPAGGYEEVDEEPKVGAVLSTPEANPYRKPD